MDKKKVAKWIIATVAITAVAAFVAGVAFEVRAIKKMNVDMENDEEPKADDFIEGDIA
jgi:galactose-1-phosphate uridylyltransferase